MKRYCSYVLSFTIILLQGLNFKINQFPDGFCLKQVTALKCLKLSAHVAVLHNLLDLTKTSTPADGKGCIFTCVCN